MGRGSPYISLSSPITCDTMSRTDQPGQGVRRFQSASARCCTSSDIASMEWVQASA